MPILFSHPHVGRLLIHFIVVCAGCENCVEVIRTERQKNTGFFPAKLIESGWRRVRGRRRNLWVCPKCAEQVARSKQERK